MEGSSQGFSPAAPRTDGQIFSCRPQDQGHSYPHRLGLCDMTVPSDRWHELPLHPPPATGAGMSGVHPIYHTMPPSWAEKGAGEAEGEGQPHGRFQNPGGEEVGKFQVFTDTHTARASILGGAKDQMSTTAKGEGGTAAQCGQLPDQARRALACCPPHSGAFEEGKDKDSHVAGLEIYIPSPRLGGPASV